MSRYIDADALIAKMPTIMDMQDTYLPIHFKEWLIDTAPSIDIEPKRGEWIAVSSYDAFGGSEELWNAHGNPTAFHYCSKCKAQSYANEFGEELLTDFCPNCGADMKGADDEYVR